MMDEHKVEFEKRWQQEVVRLKTEQAVYNDQVSNVDDDDDADDSEDELI